MKDMIVSIIGGLLVVIAIIIMAMYLTGCVHYPEVKDMPDKSPSSCLDYQRCLYYSASGKMSLDCSKIYDRCDKDRTWLECQKDRPEGVKFQECWDKKR